MRASSAEQFSVQYGRVLNSSGTFSSSDGHDVFCAVHDISVDELIIRDVEQTLRLDIEKRCKQWQKVVICACRALSTMTSISLLSLIISPFPYAALNVKVDGDYLVGARSKGGYPARWASKSHLAIPHGMHMTGIQPTADLTHPRIPESIKDEYLPKVQSLFRTVPRARALLMNLEVSKPLHLKHLKTSIDRDHEGSCGTFFPPAELHICTEELRTIESPPCFLSSIPPASEFTKGASEVNRALLCNDSPREVQNGEVVLTFSLYAKSSSSLPRAQRMQDVDVLGTQTLQQLRDSFSCGGGRGKMTTEERPHNGSGHEYAYFLIEGDFYATDAIRAANSSDNVSENSSGPNGVWAVRDWLLNQRGDSRTNIPTREQQSSGEPSDGGTSAGMREGTSCGASSSAVVLNDSRGPRGANCNSKALKQKRATRRSAGRLGDRDTDDGATSASTSLTGISSSSATAFDDNTGTEGVGSVAALITANEIVCSSERLKRKDGSVRKKKSSKTVKRTFASAWVVAEGDDSDNDVVANKSNDAFAIPLTVASETASTTVGQRRESNRIASPTRMGVTADDSQNETARSRLARSRSLLEVHGMPPSSALRVLPLDVSVGSLVLRAGVRYLYRHGTDSSCDCEHFLYLTDMHMHCCGNINSSNSNSNSTASVNAFPMFQFQDLPLLGSYPRQTFSAKAIAKKCGVCLLWSARYVVQGDRLADKSPMLYCQHCYFMMHYSPAGELIYDDFTVMQYEQLEFEAP